MKQHKKRSLGGFIFGIVIAFFGAVWILESRNTGYGTLSPFVALIGGAIIIYIYIRDTFLLGAVDIKQKSAEKARAQAQGNEAASNRMELMNTVYSIGEKNGGFECMTIRIRDAGGVDLVAKNGKWTYSFAQLGYYLPGAGIIETAKEFARMRGLLYTIDTYVLGGYSIYEQVSAAVGRPSSSDGCHEYIGAIKLFTPEYSPEYRVKGQAQNSTYKPL